MQSWLVAHWVEITGVVTGAACVILAARRSMWTYPVGIANTALYLVVFTESALYADAALQIMFMVLSVTGWIDWARARRRESEAHLQRDDAFVGVASTGTLLLLALGFVVALAAIAYVLHAFTDSTTELPDATVTAGSVIAQIMLNRRWWQCWLVWLAVDVVSVGLYAYKGLWPTAVLYLGFCVIVLVALRDWRRVLTTSREKEAVGV
ncbi:nicotinamide mononucleotide transporter [Nocardioides luteus]|uniref:Nicotinamide mononucleotide transporter n=1 Tax=Nocardioides luteus TaxID=1844 RepID=A0ABQ5T1Y7_9ACTN|nr:nicotinamide riboside transporter PnuC [Nocardioides luteus]MDR7313574.1 nicotinamide mononucleotide transporter [Nocardioides luteus]GGR68956.1 putative nicotinamide mononucleotide transporter [Nocardioides luteus]GLJ69196.1 putative nicotinamide mononucleotide transporter [Nocardioides luteus]